VAATCLEHPPALLESLRGVSFVCPLCRGGLDVRADGYRCAPCGRAYALHAGIPDFRVFPDPYLSFEEDCERTERVLAVLDRHTFPSLLEYYWGLSDITPPPLRQRFIRGAIVGEAKARRLLRTLGEDGGRTLEVGSGTGNFLAVAGRREQVVGIDIAMRWLHLSRRRFLDRGQPVPPLVCCCAEHLPFPGGGFDRVVSSATLEFARDQGRVLSECARVLRPGGRMLLNTANRFALAEDPYACLWGVGFLPRAWQARYVRWRRGASYGPVRTLSLREVDRLAAAHFERREFVLPDVEDDQLAALPPLKRVQAHGYRLLRRLPVVRGLLREFAPQWDVLLTKESDQPPLAA
jgi:SAM-dependent methyltransferase